MNNALRLSAGRYWSDRRGVFALWFGVAMIPMMLFAAVGLDLMRAVNMRSQLQAAADAAALAGATAFTSASASGTATTIANRYMAGAVGQLTSSNTASPPS
ncbi:TadE/TadG family type IV pilus assembly protein [Methylobacterium trifolii]|uniref:Putative Flp pilus-assembly TadG-like N-terminal domain-containing protein n=1 Tax=Methylobacterium trifolii TaxID=1003092 RepID=A0ABQ4U393_9HYPH|nr:pilus assembly protein TadG-related protein [Methylobacterium trifolii]GJE61324.1 hypothetical protein MPOCJGCO_3446 [Methylobacterium trifolii]